MAAAIGKPKAGSSTVASHLLTPIETVLERVDEELAARYPGDGVGVQPVHTVYVSAAEATPETPTQWSAAAIELLDQHLGMLRELGDRAALGLVRQRLAAAPIADLRLDFEDGYGPRGEDLEDADAVRAGQTLAALGLDNCGVRIKGLTTAEWRRSLRTLELVLDGAGGVPAGFVFVLPKLRAVGQVTAAVQLCVALEQAHGLPAGGLKFELQIESPQAIIGPDGVATLAQAIHLSQRRCTGLHYGTYDYSAGCGIAPQHQALDHPVADHAKAVMLAAAAQTGVWVADGSTNIVPVGTEEQVAQSIRDHYRLVIRSLERGYYQGWDLHPGHLVTRWLASFTFFRAALVAAAPRLQGYLERSGGRFVDEPATAEALATIVLRGLNCGAFSADEVIAAAPDATVAVLRALKLRMPQERDPS
ncbi:Citrate lyase beta subunit [Mycobacterium basiliense]|uniref:Citrate lyase beta subunit n=1 Tax=Mycobacterium basiliense TaxID=2094119 RepID=A0A447GAP7_9MYCO|nr:aldolase [Mycobacterium basiliense]VDM87549.1 Citrate lyase beta subunit [Mycobacterium basiliense]